jgi:hypothetical protein
VESLALLIISSVQASSSSTFSNVDSHDTCPSQFYFLILIFNCFLVQSSIDQAIWEGGRELNDRLTGGVKPLDPLRAPPQPVFHSRPQRPSSREGKFMDFIILTVGWL